MEAGGFISREWFLTRLEIFNMRQLDYKWQKLVHTQVSVVLSMTDTYQVTYPKKCL
jgi:hypothetical protein